MTEFNKMTKMLEVIQTAVNGFTTDNKWEVLDVFNAVFGTVYEDIDEVNETVLQGIK